MIENLADFKIITKRISKLLQEFDLTKIDTFKLSNSAALNLMARILGYENYNTIKPVLENSNLKEDYDMKFIQHKNRRYNCTKLRDYGLTNSTTISFQYEIFETDFNSDSCSMVYDFKHENEAKVFMDKCDMFMQSKEMFFNADEEYSRLQNMDNRANQKNHNYPGTNSASID